MRLASEGRTNTGSCNFGLGIKIPETISIYTNSMENLPMSGAREGSRKSFDKSVKSKKKNFRLSQPILAMLDEKKDSEDFSDRYLLPTIKKRSKPKSKKTSSSFVDSPAKKIALPWDRRSAQAKLGTDNSEKFISFANYRVPSFTNIQNIYKSESVPRASYGQEFFNEKSNDLFVSKFSKVFLSVSPQNSTCKTDKLTSINRFQSKRNSNSQNVESAINRTSGSLIKEKPYSVSSSQVAQKNTPDNTVLSKLIKGLISTKSSWKSKSGGLPFQ